MGHRTLTKAVEFAKAASDAVTDYKGETYLAVLLAQLLTPPAETPVQQAPGPSDVTHPGSARPFSAPEFFASKHCKSDVVKIVLAGYFLENYSGIERFNVNDIRNCLVSAKVPLPKNTPLAVLKSVQRGWLMEVPEGKESLKAYALTQTGQGYVATLDKGEEAHGKQ